MKTWTVIRTLVMLLALALMPWASGCIVKKDSPAPGCVEYWGLAPMGGCFGKTVILDLQVEPSMDCLTIEVNNCNGGVLEVRNACGETLLLGSLEIAPTEGLVSLDVVKGEDGQYLLTRTGSNFAEYTPQEDERIEIGGTLGQQEIRVSFTKTKELC